MRGGPFRRATALRGIAALCLAAILALAALAPGPAGAQGFADYNRLFGAGAGQAPEGGAEPPPRQSLPASEFDPESVPSAEDYARLEGRMDTPTLSAALRSIVIFRERLVATLTRAPDAFYEMLTTLEAASPTGKPSYFLGVAIFVMLLIALGRAAGHIFAVYVARPLFVGLQKPDPQGYAEKMPVLAYRMMLTGVGVALTLGVASAAGLVYHDGHEATLTTALIILGAWGAVQVVDTLWRMALCPFLPNYRIPHLTERDARRLYRWLTWASGFGIVSFASCLWMRALGLSQDVYVLMTIVLTSILVAGLLVMIRTNARAITGIIEGGRPREAQSWLTLAAMRLWAPLGVLYLVLTWARLCFELVLGVPTGPQALMIPYLVLVGGLVVYAGASWAIERVFSRSREIAALNRAARERQEAAARARFMAEAGEESFGASDASGDGGDGDETGSAIRAHAAETPQPEPPTRGMRSFEDLARRVASLFAIGAAVWILLYTWGGPEIFAETMALGIAQDMIDILFVGYVAFHAVRIWMDQKIREEVGEEDPSAAIMEGEGGGAGASRLATLLPLVRNFILAIMAIAIALAAASELGFNVAPLFAGAGIVGLAIGFGSQTLVRDILSGAFYLLDDAFRKGEYIDVGSVKGTVEKISLRSFQLRHHLGMLHTIPFGEIGHLTNFSRDWVMMKLPLRLTYDTDVEKVRKLVKKLGQQLLEDPTVGDKFLQPLKSQGVIDMEESAMIVRVKFMTRPGDQWVVRKRVYQEIRELFEREGIKFAHREVTVRIPDLPQERELGEEERQAVGAAARTAIDVVEPQALAPTGTGGSRDER